MVAAATLVAFAGSAARAGISEPEIAVDGGTGIPGGTVAVTLSLSDDVADAGVSLGVDLHFAAEALEFFEPVDESCAVAERLSETHGVAGRLVEDSVLNIEVFVAGAPNPPPPLGDGEIVTCDFRVRDGVPAGTVALEIEAPFLGDAEGGQIPVRVRNGSVQIIVEPPTSTPTATSTPQPTNTVTGTVAATATDTPQVTATVTDTPEVSATPTASATVTNTGPVGTSTSTATATRTPTGGGGTATATATATRTGGGGTPTATRGKGDGDDGCNVVPVGADATPGAAVLLVIPALLLWVRRRSA
jgi:hypothetical protein